MTYPDMYETRIRLIDLATEHYRYSFADLEETPEYPTRLFKLLRIYRADTERKLEGREGTLDYFWSQLKIGVRLADRLINELLEDEAEHLEGWYYGTVPKNAVQGLYGMLWATAVELTISINEIEEAHPEDRLLFKLEREAFARLMAEREARNV